MLMKKIKQGKAMESDESCYFRKRGRDALPDKVTCDQEPGQNGWGRENKKHGYWGRMFQVKGTEGRKSLR